MTTLTTTAGVPARARWALASAWVKLRSVRSTYLTLATAAVAAATLAAAAVVITRRAA